MPRRLIRRYLPRDHHFVTKQRLGFLGDFLHDQNLWHLNRHSVSGAFATGIFVAFLPLPFQMIVAALGAIWFRVNLPLSVILVWISNPVTMVPIFGICYMLGAWIFGLPTVSLDQIALELPNPSLNPSTIKSLIAQFLPVWSAMLVGGIIIGSIAAGISYVVVRRMWRLKVLKNWERRRQNRQLRETQAKS